MFFCLAVMFQIVLTLVLEVPAFFQFMHELQGDDNCGCLSSDQTASYVHGLSLMLRGGVTISEDETAPVPTEESDSRFGRACYLGVGRPGSVSGSVQVS